MIINTDIQPLLRDAWQIRQYHEPLLRLVNIDWRRYVPLVMTGALCVRRLLDLRGRHSAFCHGAFLLVSSYRCVLSAYLDRNLFGLRLLGLGEGHGEQPMRILRLDFVLVDFHRQLHMSHKRARGPFAPMEGFRCDVPSHPSFLPCHAQGMALDMEMQATRVDTWSEGLDVHRLCIFIEIDQRVMPGCPARQKRRPGRRHTPRDILIKDAVDFPTQRFQCVPRAPLCHDALSCWRFAALGAIGYFCILCLLERATTMPNVYVLELVVIVGN